MEIDDLTLHWLAGLLEGEASFLLFKKGNFPTPRIDIHMKDEDVIAKVAKVFGVSYQHVQSERMKLNGWSEQYGTNFRGQRAFKLMQLLYPLMGNRRKAQIDKVRSNYQGQNRIRALTPEQMEELRQRALNGESPFHLAKEYKISKSLAYIIRDGYTYTGIESCEHSSSVEHLPSKQDRRVRFPLLAHNLLNNNFLDTTTKEYQEELHWLAGLLEAEGSFMAPVPSAPNLPIISIAMTDEDVIEHVALLFDVKYQRYQPKNEKHKMNFICRLRGNPAARLMHELYPLMGQRRKGQIDRALANYTYDPDRVSDRSVKLDEDKVREIKRRLARGDFLDSIARAYGVTKRTIRDIERGITWSQVEVEE